MAPVRKVIITPNAQDDLWRAFEWYRDHNPRAAEDWLSGIRNLILDLGSMPESHPVAPESEELGAEVRRALYGRSTRWRIYFLVSADRVDVLHVRDGRRSNWAV